MDKLNAKIAWDFFFLKTQDKRNLPARKAAWLSRPAFPHGVTHKIYHNDHFNTCSHCSTCPGVSQAPRTAGSPWETLHGVSGNTEMTLNFTPSPRHTRQPWARQTTAFIQLEKHPTASNSQKTSTNQLPPPGHTCSWQHRPAHLVLSKMSEQKSLPAAQNSTPG